MITKERMQEIRLCIPPDHMASEWNALLDAAESAADLRAESDRLRERIELIRKQTTVFSPSLKANKCALCGYPAGDHFTACPMEEDVK